MKNKYWIILAILISNTSLAELSCSANGLNVLYINGVNVNVNVDADADADADADGNNNSTTVGCNKSPSIS